MTESKQMADDLRFLREVVQKQKRGELPRRVISFYWAAYVLVGYTIIDVAPRWAGWFFLVGGVGGAFFSVFVGRRTARQTGQINRNMGRRVALHWIVGFFLVFVASFGLACVIPALRGNAGSQVLVVMIGFLYYFYGVHVDGARHLMWAGPIVMAGGICVSFFPHHGWTALGILIAAIIVLPVFQRRPSLKQS